MKTAKDAKSSQTKSTHQALADHLSGTRSTAARGPNLLALIQKQPRLLHVLDEYGIHFCAGCYLTLAASPERAAAYHGVPNISDFLKEVARISRAVPERKHSRRRQ